jgi:hypothetical protein
LLVIENIRGKLMEGGIDGGIHLAM